MYKCSKCGRLTNIKKHGIKRYRDNLVSWLCKRCYPKVKYNRDRGLAGVLKLTKER